MQFLSISETIGGEEKAARFLAFAREHKQPVRSVPLNQAEYEAATEAVKQGLARVEAEGTSDQRFVLV